MVKLISIVLSSLILGQSFQLELGDLVQLDELIEHAQFHNEEHGDNLLVFISKHYGEAKAAHNEKHQEEKEQHEQLPFQHNSFLMGFSVFVLADMKVDINDTLQSNQRSTTFFYQVQDYECYKSGIFQPPRQS